MRILYRVGCVVLAIIVVAVAYLWSAIRYQPEFYVKAIAPPADPMKQAAEADHFERTAFDLNSRVRREGTWQARFTADEINSFMAADFNRKFPSALPSSIQEPRVAISSELLELAFRYEGSAGSGVVVAGVFPKATDVPGEIALRIAHIRLGKLPLPLKQFLNEVTQASHRAKLPVRWTEEMGNPVAIFTLPTDHPDLAGHDLVIEQILLEPGAIVVSGRTQRAAR